MNTQPLRAALLRATLLLATPALAETHTDPTGTIIPAVSPGDVKEVCVTPAVTSGNAYGADYVVGPGPLAFPLLFPPSGGGVIESVFVNVNQVETSGFTFVPLSGQTSATTWTNAAVASISGSDKQLVRGAISLSASSVLGTHTTLSALGLGQAINSGGATFYGILVANAALTNNFTSTSDVQVCVDVLQAP